jgi:hypothetical protein
VAIRKKTTSEATQVPDAASGSAPETASTSKSTSASASPAVSISEKESASLPISNKVETSAVERSSLELRVLPSFDPRVKLLVEMMRQIDNVKVEIRTTRSDDADKLKKEIDQQFSDRLKKARMEVKFLQIGADTQPKTVRDRIADFLPVAAKIIKGKHPDYIGWLTLDKKRLGKDMEKYIDFFYGVGGNTPGTELSKKIADLLDKAESYFDELIKKQEVAGGARDNQRVGLASIKEFLAESASEIAPETAQ